MGVGGYLILGPFSRDYGSRELVTGFANESRFHNSPRLLQFFRWFLVANVSMACHSLVD